MNTHYRHFRETVLQKNYTLCGVVNTKGHLMIGLAVCNPDDQFVKKLGREVSFSHAHVQPVAELVVPEGEYSGHVFHQFVNGFLPLTTFHAKITLDDFVDALV